MARHVLSDFAFPGFRLESGLRPEAHHNGRMAAAELASQHLNLVHPEDIVQDLVLLAIPLCSVFLDLVGSSFLESLPARLGPLFLFAVLLFEILYGNRGSVL